MSYNPRLDARPPTPPLDIDEDIHDALNFLENDIKLDQVLPSASYGLSVATPPSSSPLRNISRDSHAPKRVGFRTTPIATQPGSSPARSRLLKPPKSILKLTSSPLPTPEESNAEASYFPADEPASFARMLESVLKQLESPQAYTRLDAYMSMNSALAAYEDVPDRDELIKRISKFQEFLLRDTATRPHESSNYQITQQALKFAALLVADHRFVRHVDINFQTHILDRCINMLDSATAAPKSIIKTASGLLAQQNVLPTVLTNARTEKLLGALETIETRCSGSSIVAIRLTIYRKLISQAPSTMFSRMGDWLLHGLRGMISANNDIQIRAIDLVTHAAMTFGTSNAATRILHDLLEGEMEDEPRSFFEHFTMSLARLTQDQELAALIPQIWSAIVLFHRNHRQSIYSWRRFKQWTRILQPCLNSADQALRGQANIAWRKLVYVVRPTASTEAPLAGLLMKPIVAGFTKNGPDKRSKELRQYALDGYYNLLHYALRPELDNESLDKAWTNYVAETMLSMASASHKGRAMAARILHGLLTAKNGTTWNSEAALDESAISPDDLPRLDVRWVRTRLSKLLPIIEGIVVPQLFEKDPSRIIEPNIWSTLLKCIVEAGRQEVRLSPELKDAIIELCNAVHRVTAKVELQPETTETDKTSAMTRVSRLVSSMVQTIGLNQWSEAFVVRDADGNATLAVSSSRPDTTIMSPLISVFISIVGKLSTEALQDLLTTICSVKTTAPAKVDYLFQLWQGLSSADVDAWATWQGIAAVWTQLISEPEISIPLGLLQLLRQSKLFLSSGIALANTPMAKSDAIDGIVGVILTELQQLSEQSGGSDNAPALEMKEIINTIWTEYGDFQYRERKRNDRGPRTAYIGTTPPSVQKNIANQRRRMRPAFRTVEAQASWNRRFSTEDGESTTKAAGSSSNKKLFKTPRLRHDDSQVEFVPIAKPPPLNTEESQHLTDNQREVSSRQEENAQLYPDLSSSPVPALYSARDSHPHVDFGQLPSSPPQELLDTPDALAGPDAEFVEPSPTPARAKKSKRRASEGRSQQPVEDTTDLVMTDAYATSQAQATNADAQDRAHDNNDGSSSDHVQNITEIATTLHPPKDMINAEDLTKYQPAPATPRPAHSHTTDTSYVSATTTPKTRSAEAATPDQDSPSNSRVMRNGDDHTEQVEDELDASQRQLEDEMAAYVAASPAHNTTVIAATTSSQSKKRKRSTKNKSEPTRKSRRRSSAVPEYSKIPEHDGDETGDEIVVANSQSRSQEGLLNSRQSHNEQSQLASFENSPEGAALPTWMDDVVPATVVTASPLATVRHHLREALNGFKTLILGRSEEREIDDLLFDLRQANHEAGRRGLDRR